MMNHCSILEKSIAEENTPTYFCDLLEKIKTGKARVGIVGLGYVGLPLACAFAQKGHIATGFEENSEKTDRLQKGESYVDDIPQSLIRDLTLNGRFKTTLDFSALAQQDVIIICVPTPLSKSKDPDVSYILAAAKSIQENIRPGQLIVLESTTYPGTTRDILLPLFTRPDFKVGRDFFLAFSPERIDPGNKQYTIQNMPKVVGGITYQCRELVVALYERVVKTVFSVSSVEAAEMSKLLENTFRAVNIGLANEMAIICDLLKINVWEVIEAAKTKPFGFMPFYPGPGIGGHCIPLDPHYLAWKVRSLNYEPRFIALADAINTKMPEYVVDKTADILNMRGICLSRSHVLVLGVAYKKDSDDIRESPALDVIRLLLQKRATVSYCDPHIPSLTSIAPALHSLALNEQLLKEVDLVLILTDHSAIDYTQVLQNARAILDTRNILKDVLDPKVYSL